MHALDRTDHTARFAARVGTSNMRDGVTVHHVEVWTHVNANGGPPADPWSITGFDLGALDHARPAFVEAVRRLAYADGAARCHCTAGKDRTDLLALLPEAVGVVCTAVVEDFALTEARIEPIRQRLLADAERRGVARADFARLLGATPDLIEPPALEHLDRRLGAAGAYRRRYGASDATLERLRVTLTI
ncbi:MAG: tyrosine-protein phosphatase [bacterium]|nr:tyrosine-protein phosphatase [bacterium]